MTDTVLGLADELCRPCSWGEQQETSSSPGRGHSSERKGELAIEVHPSVWDTTLPMTSHGVLRRSRREEMTFEGIINTEMKRGRGFECVPVVCIVGDGVDIWWTCHGCQFC